MSPSAERDPYRSAFEDGARDASERPDAVLATLGDLTGARVLDFGAGSGYFTWPLAAVVGPTGRVYASERDPSLVAWLAAEAERRGLSQVECLLSDTPERPLPAKLDLILLARVWHHLSNHDVWTARFNAALSPTGRLLLIGDSRVSRFGVGR